MIRRLKLRTSMDAREHETISAVARPGDACTWRHAAPAAVPTWLLHPSAWALDADAELEPDTSQVTPIRRSAPQPATELVDDFWAEAA